MQEYNEFRDKTLEEKEKELLDSCPEGIIEDTDYERKRRKMLFSQ